MKYFVIRWQNERGHLCDTKYLEFTAKDALKRFQREIAILSACGKIAKGRRISVIGIFDASWFDGIDGRPEGVHLHLVEA